jgi:hypothetical protein
VTQYNASRYIGDYRVAIDGWPTLSTGSDYDQMKTYDRVLGAPHADMHAVPASFYQVDVYILTTANNNAKDSASQKAPWPFALLAADVACETCAATTGTVDIMCDRAGGTTYVSILDAAVDVKTAAGVGQRVSPTNGSEVIEYGDTFIVRQTAGSASAMVGGQAHMYCKRL